ncbi:MAG: hypothetical protein WCB68_04250, partial [Pyrinomonadaceae bacterium]
MKRTLVSLLLVFSLCQTASFAQTAAQSEKVAVTLIKAGRLIDVRAGRVLENQGILVEGERIRAVGPFS